MLKAELEALLGYEKYNKEGYGSGNSRNGFYSKKFKNRKSWRLFLATEMAYLSPNSSSKVNG